MNGPKTDINTIVRNPGGTGYDGSADILREKILSKLIEHGANVEELAASLKVSGPVISECLKSLEEDGVAGSKPDPASSGGVVYFVKSNYLGGISQKDRMEIDLKDYISRYMSRSGDPLEFFGLILRTLRIALINEGIDIDPVQHEAGIDMGEVLYGELKDPDINGLLGNIAAFWEAHKLGQIKVESFDPLTIIVYECFECGDLPYLGRPACSFDAGILEAVFSAHFKNEYKALETHCYAMGNDYCRFVIAR